jgi:hypothetical protein
MQKHLALSPFIFVQIIYYNNTLGAIVAVIIW